MKRAYLPNLLWIMLLGGCYIEPFSDPVPVPANYSVPAPVESRVVQTPPSTAPTTQTVTVTAAPIVLNAPTRAAVGEAVRSILLKKYTLDSQRELNEYIVLVGSLVALGNPDAQADFQFLVLDTSEAVSFAIHPATIAISKGLIRQMEDESELAGVIAREMTHLQTGRAFKALGFQSAEAPTTRTALANPTTPVTLTPATKPTTQAAVDPALVSAIAPRVAALLEKQSFGQELDRQADLEGARLAAAARYAPDGYLRLLTRQKADWRRVEALDAAVQIVAKAHPHADVRLPARFEQYLPKDK